MRLPPYLPSIAFTLTLAKYIPRAGISIQADTGSSVVSEHSFHRARLHRHRPGHRLTFEKQKYFRWPQDGFSLVELLVVVAIIGILVAFLLPAIQAARESARRSTCNNNLRQAGLAALLHTQVIGHYPTGGWGGSWTGDPNRGHGRSQPGGWLFAVLDHLEESAVRSMNTAVGGETGKRLAASQAMSVVIPTIHCPSRRAAKLYPMPWPYPLVNVDPPSSVARSDYAMNAGDTGVNSLGLFGQAGPLSFEDAKSSYSWPASNIANGITYFRSEVRERHVLDGTSKTYLVGEKSMSARDYEDGQAIGDRGFALIGFAPDTVRMTLPNQSPSRDAKGDSFASFGSAHPSTCGFVFCDGSVRNIAFEIDPELHRSQGNRRDQ